jgi:uncharacterized membrane protein
MKRFCTKRLPLAALYAGSTLAGLYHWELIRAWGSFSYGLYHPFFGTEGFVVLSALLGVALLAGWLVAPGILKPEKGERAGVRLATAFLAWFPFSAVALIPFGNLERFLMAEMLTAFLLPFACVLVERWAERVCQVRPRTSGLDS